MRPSAPASTGPAGAHFEGQVGAHYLLAMLVGSEPRGLPRTTIARIEFQRGSEGHPLDDIVVHAHDDRGCSAVLEIQVKRTASFAPSDQTFREVVFQIAEASRQSELLTTRHEFAVAVARSSHRIEASYQEVLTWARRLSDAKTFVDRIRRPGSANEHMRTFVETFENNVRDARAAHDDETVWSLLSRFHILPFDYTTSGSIATTLDIERAARALHHDEVSRADDFRRVLVEAAIETAASGGDWTRERLIDRVRKGAFRLTGFRRYQEARRAIAEASRLALKDIGDRVGGVALTRVERVTAVRTALDQGRYVEIRGEAGVGKSALLKHVAEELSKDATIIVLSPRRTPNGGWMRMRAMLNFDGTAHDLLLDMVASGSTIIFLDGLDFFTQEERLTVKDLVREAATVPGVSVIATARSDFGGADDPNWLPADALDSLGRTDAVTVDELSVPEVDELRSAVPGLGPLLAESHPARAVARNLFRLARLADRPSSETFRTEVDMAEQWWRTADGGTDGRRDRARLLEALAEHAIAGTELTNPRGHPSQAIDALVQRQALRDLGSDRVEFRHDIYRDWAIANVLYSQPAIRKRLALERPAPAALVRGVELAARLSLERGDDDSGWQSLLDDVSQTGSHGSWRRAVLLAPVRSEVSRDCLRRISRRLLASDAFRLRELIRTVIAVDSVPAREFASPGVDPATIPEHLHFPHAPSWWHLIFWLLSVEGTLPPAAIPDVVDLYSRWCLLGEDQLTPKLVASLHRWLTEIESAHYQEHYQRHCRPFGGALSNEHVSLLETNLRSTFLSRCHHIPPLAAKYLKSLDGLRHGDSVVGDVLKSPGSLARAAPEELAQLTISELIPAPDQAEPDSRSNRRAFRYTSHHYVLPSPELEPFLSLLTHAPPTGLKLIHRIVDHAISVYGTGRNDNSNLIIIPFEDADRTFSFPQSYTWSRAFLAPDGVVTTALIALFTWGNNRLNAGSSVDSVLTDLLSSSNPSAAYLLVAADLLRTHWPRSRDAAIPFVACPELLCLDQELSLDERFRGGMTETSASRTTKPSLYDLLSHYAVFPPSEHRDRLASLLRAAAERLGPYAERSDRGDPDFMAFHALNRVDPGNWKSVDQSDGTRTMNYMVPDEEERHLAPLSEELEDEHSERFLQSRIMSALENPTESSPDLAEEAAEWAQRQSATVGIEHVVVASAALAMRDGSNGLRDRTEAWARIVFDNAFQSSPKPFGADGGIWFNPVAIAFVGWTHLLNRSNAQEDRRSILELASRDDCAAIPGFRTVSDVLTAIDRRLSIAILRTSFAACIFTCSESQHATEHTANYMETDRGRVSAAIIAELSWLDGTIEEPTWPHFPVRPLRRRTVISLLDSGVEAECNPPDPRLPKHYANLYAAARWLECACDLFDAATEPWMRRVADSYRTWTARANGTERDETPRHDSALFVWNTAYFKLVAHCLPGMENPEMDAFALSLITSLRDEAFFDACDILLRNVDKRYFSGQGISEPHAVHIRSRLVDRLVQSRGWRQHDVRSMSMETNLGRAVAALFLADGYSRPPRCLLRPDGVDRMAPLLPVLQPIARRSSVYHVALSLFEVEPRPAHLDFIISSAESWLTTHPESGMFWVDYEAGRRLCATIDAIRQQQPPSLRQRSELRTRVDHVVSSLVRVGVTEASHLEEELQAIECN